MGYEDSSHSPEHESHVILVFIDCCCAWDTKPVRVRREGSAMKMLRKGVAGTNAMRGAYGYCVVLLRYSTRMIQIVRYK